LHKILELQHINAGILKDVSLCLPCVRCLAVSGPSGSGKTTLLNVIAGNRAYSGRINYMNKNIDGVPSWKRGFRYLNQRLYLFPYLTIDANLALAQYAAGKKMDKRERRACLAAFEIEHLASRKPQLISGGEQQRAALARALIGSPKLLLLDEPFSSLDWSLKTRLWEKLIEIKKTLPVILVSHEPKEIDALADECVYLENGIIKVL